METKNHLSLQGVSGIFNTKVRDGGAKGSRTPDLLHAMQALSQLSYGPIRGVALPNLVGLGGFEPPTSPLSGVRSNQLSYRPKLCLLTQVLSRLSIRISQLRYHSLTRLTCVGARNLSLKRYL